MGQSLTLYLISGVLALIPAIIWLSIIFKNTQKRGMLVILFAASTFSVVPILLLQYLLNLFPQFDIIQFLQAKIQDQNINYLLLFISVGIVEEIIKQVIIRLIDHRYLLIKTINDSITLSLVSALGFSFAENIFYIYSIYTQLGIEQLFVAYLFRSIFTTCAHLIFSGYFGYYYGIAKFALNIVEQEKMIGAKKRFTGWIARTFDLSTFEAYKQLTILKGATIAIIMHAVFDFILQLNQILPVIIFVIVGFLILLSLLQKKSGQLILISDINNGQTSTMAKKDEDVVLELLGMWFKEKKYVDVIHICQRLLERDPGNRVVQIFKAKSIDKLKKNDAYSLILKNLFPTKNNNKSLAAIIKEQNSIENKLPKPTSQPLTNSNQFTQQQEKQNSQADQSYYKLKL